VGTPALLRGVDLAAFAAALVVRLRGAGVAVSADGQANFVQALRRLAPHTASALYWAARLTLVNRRDDLAAFDAVFAAVFGTAPPDGAPARDPLLALPGATTPAAGTVRRAGGRAGPPAAAESLPWTTRTADERDHTSLG
jgi:uncharacterized protein with von Willebrand factor type A (vWA) domain